MPDDLVSRLRNAADWDFDSDGSLLREAADEIERLRKENHAFALRIQDAWKRIERLRKENHAFALRIQDAWKRIETLGQDPPADQQVEIVKAWGWVRVANHHDANPERDGADVKRCHHLDTDWCSQRDKGRMIPVLRPPIGAGDA